MGGTRNLDPDSELRKYANYVKQEDLKFVLEHTELWISGTEL